MGYGKKAARNIDELLVGEKRAKRLSRPYDYDQTPPAQVSEAGRHAPAHVPAAERVANFEEVSLGLNAEQAAEEASRCLRCDIRSAEA
jgi:NADH-quinone oxidoreductase subunit F